MLTFIFLGAGAIIVIALVVLVMASGNKKKGDSVLRATSPAQGDARGSTRSTGGDD